MSYRVALASHLLLTDSGGRILTIRRAGTSYLDGYWSVPAGHVEPGETAIEACIRETSEEVGVTLTPEALTFWLVQQKAGIDGEERVDFFFDAKLPRCQQPRRASLREVSELRWVAPSDLPRPFAPYVEHALAVRGPNPDLSLWGF